MAQKKNKAFVLSIVMLSLAALLFVITVLGRPAGGSIDGAVFLFSIPVFILSHVALIKGITHTIRRIPRGQETIIMSSIAIVIIVMTFICLGYLLGTGRLPHEIYFY